MATFITPQALNISGVSAQSWTQMNLSGIVPATATGVILNAFGGNSGISTYFGARMSGSGDTYISGQTVSQYNQKQLITGLRTSDLSFDFYSYAVGAGVALYLLGYFESDASWFSTAPDGGIISQTPTWADLDLSALVPAGTKAVIATVSAYSATAMRPKGSTDDWYTNSPGGIAQSMSAIIGVDANRVVNGKTGNGGIHLRLLGYITAGLTLNASAIDRTPGVTGSFQSLATTAGAIGYLYQMGSSGSYNFSLVTSGGTVPYAYMTSFSSGEMCTGTPPTAKIANVGAKIWELGYFTSVSSVDPGVLGRRSKGYLRPGSPAGIFSNR